jgi:hypothetical protein
MIFWNPSNLTKHYQKHPCGACKNCWASTLGGPSPIPSAVYERVSLASEADAWLSFQARYREDSTSPENTYKYFLTGKMVFSAVELPRNEIRTCYRIHVKEGNHELGTTLNDHIAIVKKIARKRDNEFGKMYGFKRVTPTQANRTNLTRMEYETLKKSTKSHLENR